MCFKILFRDDDPLTGPQISQAIDEFGPSYNRTVSSIIRATGTKSISQSLFIDNTMMVLTSFKMTRQGVFKGLGIDPNGKPREGDALHICIFRISAERE